MMINKFSRNKKIVLYVTGIFLPMVVYVMCKKTLRGIILNGLFSLMMIDMYLGVMWNNDDLYTLSSRVGTILFVIITLDVINLVRKS